MCSAEKIHFIDGESVGRSVKERIKKAWSRNSRAVRKEWVTEAYWLIAPENILSPEFRTIIL